LKFKCGNIKEEDKQIGKRIDNKVKPKDSFQPYYKRSHHLTKDKEKEFEKFVINVRDSIKEQDFQQEAAEAEPYIQNPIRCPSLYLPFPLTTIPS
jgi:hypothetical protein